MSPQPPPSSHLGRVVNVILWTHVPCTQLAARARENLKRPRHTYLYDFELRLQTGTKAKETARTERWHMHLSAASRALAFEWAWLSTEQREMWTPLCSWCKLRGSHEIWFVLPRNEGHADVDVDDDGTRQHFQ